MTIIWDHIMSFLYFCVHTSIVYLCVYMCMACFECSSKWCVQVCGVFEYMNTKCACDCANMCNCICGVQIHILVCVQAHVPVHLQVHVQVCTIVWTCTCACEHIMQMKVHKYTCAHQQINQYFWLIKSDISH